MSYRAELNRDRFSLREGALRGLCDELKLAGTAWAVFGCKAAERHTMQFGPVVHMILFHYLLFRGSLAQQFTSPRPVGVWILSNSFHYA